MKTTVYEGLFVLQPDLSANDLARVKGDIDKLISDAKGKILNHQDIGKRTLAYPIRKRIEGYYALVEFELDPAQAAVLSRAFRLENRIFRHILTRYEPGAKTVLRKPGADRKTTHRDTQREAPKVAAHPREGR